MNPEQSTLPEFDEPPVIEVALSVQFEPLDLAPAHFGMLALRFREMGYARIEQHPPIQAVVEQYGLAQSVLRPIRLEFGPPAVRHWFISRTGNELVQLQPDRLAQNWRKTGEGSEYPRFESILKQFKESVTQVDNLIQGENLDSIQPNQCEVTYVNHIRPCEVWSEHSEMPKVLGIVAASFTGGFLPPPEGMQAVSRFLISNADDEPVGRLHASAQCATDTDTHEPVIVLKLTARGAPLGEGEDGILAFLQLGREWIVRGFAAVTTPQMHAVWKRTR